MVNVLYEQETHKFKMDRSQRTIYKYFFLGNRILLSHWSRRSAVVARSPDRKPTVQFPSELEPSEPFHSWIHIVS